MLTRRVAVFGSLLASSVFARAYPVRQATVIVPFAPGASADGIARILASYLSTRLKTTFVTENRAGGGGAIGLIVVSKSAADGQILGLGATGAIAINPHVEGAVITDATKQLTPIAKLIDVPLVLVAHPSSGLRSLKDVIDRSKTTPKGLSYGSTGTNSSQHLVIELVKQRTGANLVHIPYRGSAPAVTDALGGQIPLASVDLTSANEHIKAGKLIGVGVTARKRYSFASDLPTISEQGVPDLEMPGWIGMFGPPALARDIVDEVSDAVAAALKDVTVISQIERLACAPAYLNAADFSKYIVEQSGRMKELLKAASK